VVVYRYKMNEFAMEKSSDRKESSSHKDSKDSESYHAEAEGSDSYQPNFVIESLHIFPEGVSDIDTRIQLSIGFQLDRQVNNSYWVFKLLVDSCDKRIVRVSMIDFRCLVTSLIRLT
jgi:hypothetical protein